jgi:hypothetical protein
MRSHPAIVSLLLATAGFSAAVLAEGRRGVPPSDGRAGGGWHPPKPPIDLVLDANHDEIIDAAEIANATNALKTLDKNGDGRITIDECMPPRPEGMGGPGGPGDFGSPEGQGREYRPGGPQGSDSPGEGPGAGGPPASRPPHPLPPIVVALDANRDGAIDTSEIDNASAALKTLDRNNDGQLSPDEYRPPRPHRRGGPGGQGERGGSGDMGGTGDRGGSGKQAPGGSGDGRD